MWNECGMVRNDAGLRQALAKIPELREEFCKSLGRISGPVVPKRA